MPLIGMSILVQLLCAVHCVRNNGNRMWLMVIIFLSLPGCLAYAVFEVLPAYAGRREVRLAKAVAIKKLDPQREVRRARDAVALADTAASRAALADALVDIESYKEAAENYRFSLAKMPSPDRTTQFKLARAELEAGNARAARKMLEELPESGSASENDRACLLLARALQDSGEEDRALELYAEVGARLPGGEAQCRRAAILLARGEAVDAELALTEVERLVKRLDRFERSQNRDMYDWAARTLVGLRGR